MKASELLSGLIIKSSDMANRSAVDELAIFTPPHKEHAPFPYKYRHGRRVIVWFGKSKRKRGTPMTGTIERKTSQFCVDIKLANGTSQSVKTFIIDLV